MVPLGSHATNDCGGARRPCLHRAASLVWLLVPCATALLYPLASTSELALRWLTSALMLSALLFSVVVHEVGHGVAAHRCGDPSVRDAGRLTLNPLVHLSFMGSLVVPFVMYLAGVPVVVGWARAVPLNPLRLRGGRKARIVPLLAGPVVNLGLAAGSLGLLLTMGVLFNCLSPVNAVSPLAWVQVGVTAAEAPLAGGWFVGFTLLRALVVINAVLAVFNLLPLPPLDGFGIVRGLASRQVNALLSRIPVCGFVVLILVLQVGLLGVCVCPHGLCDTLLAFLGLG